MVKTRSMQRLAEEKTMHSPFLKLPAELRNIIYGLLLINKGIIRIPSPYRKNAQRSVPRPKKNLRCILRTNKQIYQETRTVFYSSNRFLIGNGWYGCKIDANLHALGLFLKRVPKGCISMITKVSLCMLFEQWNESHRAVGELVFKDYSIGLSLCFAESIYEMLRGLGIIPWVKYRIVKSRELAKGGE
ncbi:uncharacterized protein PAC_16533 [Phialocephala subalpina]|uniref:F-box domain-containing protein n=1 Tax=Phialocephala subalpina TaxID=576137 RepID=A0A1L7XNM9_9HELO|nr:uncharacterized protein PAC_16533 [Phialocephala subalpina]